METFGTANGAETLTDGVSVLASTQTTKSQPSVAAPTGEPAQNGLRLPDINEETDGGDIGGGGVLTPRVAETSLGYQNGPPSDSEKDMDSDFAVEHEENESEKFQFAGISTNFVTDDSNTNVEFNRKGISLVVDVHTSANETESDDEMGDEEHEYSVGDFVWGKIKSHPWWPGRIYDPSDASPFAAKHKQTNCLLVAYFGDGSFSWCHPFQLKPFAENFEQMSQRSNSKNFLNAVEKALNEVGRVIEMQMTCSCVAERFRVGLNPPLAANAGVKAGVLAPESGFQSLSLPLQEPTDLLAYLQSVSKFLSFSSMLEFKVLKSWISAFFHVKRGYGLPIYHPPKYIEGLEDMKGIEKLSDSIDLNDHIEEEEEEEEEDDEEEEGVKSGMGISNDEVHQGRKQKSVAELMKKEMEVDAKEKTMSRKKKRKMKKIFEEDEDEDEDDGDGDRGSSLSLLSETKRGRKKSKYLSPPYMSPRSSTRFSGFYMDSDGESEKITKVARIGERMTKAAGQLAGSPRTLSETSQKKNPKIDTSGNKNPPQTTAAAEDEKNAEIDVSLTVLLSGIRYAAIHPQSPRGMKICDKFSEFISTFRNSIHFKKPIFQKHRTNRKRKSNVDPGFPGQDLNKIDQEQKGKKSARMSESEPKSNSIGSEKYKNDKELNKKASPLALIVTFPPGFSLPTKPDVVNTFAKYGAIDETDTFVSYNSYCAQVVFLRRSEAEAAHTLCLEQNPFGVEGVKFRLQYSPYRSRANNRKDSNTKTSEIPKRALEYPTRNEGSDLKFMKEKIEMMTSVLEDCDAEISTRLKSYLEGEMKEMLERVSGMMVCSS